MRRGSISACHPLHRPFLCFCISLRSEIFESIVVLPVTARFLGQTTAPKLRGTSVEYFLQFLNGARQHFRLPFVHCIGRLSACTNLSPHIAKHSTHRTDHHRYPLLDLDFSGQIQFWSVSMIYGSRSWVGAVRSA